MTAFEDYPRQAFVHTERPSRESFREVENWDPTNEAQNGGLYIKPYGGMWTSTLRETDDGLTCGWVEWCRAESWGLTDESRVFALDVGDVRVFEIDGTDDLAALLDAYGRDPGLPGLTRSFAAPDYEALRGDGYDGVRLTDRGQRETRFSRPGLYGWDAESTVWLRWPEPTVEDLGPVDEVIA